MNTIEKRRSLIKNMIESSNGRFTSVTFRKNDGSMRTLTIQPASARLNVKGDAASPSAKKGVATRAANHPNLLNVWDVTAKHFKSINLDAVTEIKTNGLKFSLLAGE